MCLYTCLENYCSHSRHEHANCVDYTQLHEKCTELVPLFTVFRLLNSLLMEDFVKLICRPIWVVHKMAFSKFEILLKIYALISYSLVKNIYSAAICRFLNSIVQSQVNYSSLTLTSKLLILLSIIRTIQLGCPQKSKCCSLHKIKRVPTAYEL